MFFLNMWILSFGRKKIQFSSSPTPNTSGQTAKRKSLLFDGSIVYIHS